MIKTAVLIVFLLFQIFKVAGQDIVTDLNGFKLGQFRGIGKNEFGEPIQQDKYEDGYEYEVFIINPDSSTYMVFEYPPGQTEVISSIQIAGKNSNTDPGFKNLKFGMNKKQVEKLLGKPDHIEPIGEYGERWEFEKSNYSVELSTGGKLSSIKITDTYSGNAPEIDKIPSFKSVIAKLGSGKNEEIAKLLSPGLEIYNKDQTLFFSKSFRNEILTDHSKIFATIKNISKGLDKINTSNPQAYEETIRISTEQNPMHVVKIKTGHQVNEIVFQYINGQYYIWEINAN